MESTFLKEYVSTIFDFQHLHLHIEGGDMDKDSFVNQAL